MSRFLIGNIKGPKGDTGPQGATGPKGEQGIQGPVGPAGGVNSVNGMTGDVVLAVKKMEYTLSPDSWTGESFPYLYTIPLPGTTASQRIYATAPPGLTEAQINAFAEAVITGNSQTDGQIVLQAVNKPSVELPIVIEIGGVVANADS